MATRAAEKLNDRQVKAVAGPAVLMDGKGLRLVIDRAGAKRWRFRYSYGGREREMGLGVYPEVSLALARNTAAKARTALRDNIDPLAAPEPKVIPTFGEAADAYVAAMEPQWRNEKHRAQWKMTLTDYAAPIRDMKVDAIDTAAVLRVLNQPIRDENPETYKTVTRGLWLARPETASRLRGRIERVLDAARANGQRTGENPARWRGHMDKLLPARRKLARGHHKALGYEHMPAFMEALRGRDAPAARALEIAILTAARSGEVRGMVWEEIDLDAKVWTVPAARMKAGREHRVPLPERVVASLLNMRPDNPAGFVFLGQRKGQPLSVMALTMVLRRMKADVTVHGFRSAFRDWAGEVSPYARELAELSLAHKFGDDTERAYRRGDALERRRPIMEAWAAWCEPRGDAEIVAFRKGA